MGYAYGYLRRSHRERVDHSSLYRPEATFKFVAPRGYVPQDGELRFDMFDAEYSHEGDRCTFETLLVRFALCEPGLRAVADIIHDIDLKEQKFGRAETSGVAAAITGLCRAHRSDEERLERGTVILESLLAFYAMKKEAAS